MDIVFSVEEETTIVQLYGKYGKGSAKVPFSHSKADLCSHKTLEKNIILYNRHIISNICRTPEERAV